MLHKIGDNFFSPTMNGASRSGVPRMHHQRNSTSALAFSKGSTLSLFMTMPSPQVQPGSEVSREPGAIQSIAMD